jgi:protein-tyrosine phosphatase
MKILVLCHGNINRSPLFAAVLRGHTKHEVRSRGFGPTGRRAPRRLRILAEEKYGYDLSEHRSRQVSPEDFGWADLIVYMDLGQKRRLALGKRPLRKGLQAVCAGTFIGRDRIPDPHFLKGAEFERAVNLTVIAAEAACATLTQ